MKRFWLLLGLIFCLAGCAGEDPALSAAMDFRSSLLSGKGFSFRGEVTADYGDSLHSFTLDCRADALGELTFTVAEPESISGITGTVSQSGGEVHFDGEAVYFPLLTDDHLTPASAPWIFLRALRSGCIRCACREEDLLHITLDDSYEEDALTLDVWLEAGNPIRGDILWQGRRILAISVTEFQIL